MSENKIHKCPTEGAKYENDHIKALSKEMANEIRKKINLNKE